MPLINLAGAADALLDLVVSTAVEEGIDLPERQYVTASASGSESWDCAQVVCGLLQFNPANAASGASAEWLTGTSVTAGAIMLPEAYLRVEIVREVPTLVRGRARAQFPPVADEHAAGRLAMRDAALLHTVRGRVATTAALTGGDPACARLGIIAPSGAEGGYAGMALAVGVTLVDVEP